MPMFDLEKKSKLFVAKCSIFELEINQDDKSEAMLALLQVNLSEMLQNIKSLQKEMSATKSQVVTKSGEKTEKEETNTNSKKLETESPAVVNSEEKTADAEIAVTTFSETKGALDPSINPENTPVVNDEQPLLAKPRVLKRKFISAKKAEISIQCPNCEKSYKSIKSLQFHSKDKHDIKLLAKDFVEAVNETECLMKNKKTNALCKKTFSNDQMPRHLETHNVEQPPLKKFRGFITSGDGDGDSFEVVWRGPNESDPPSEEEIIEDPEDIQNLNVENDAKESTDQEDVTEDKTNARDDEVHKIYPGKQKNVVLTEAQGYFNDPVGLFEDYEFLHLPPEPGVFVELDDHGNSSQINIEELEMNSSFGAIRSQESDILFRLQQCPEDFVWGEVKSSPDDDLNHDEAGGGTNNGGEASKGEILNVEISKDQDVTTTKDDAGPSKNHKSITETEDVEYDQDDITADDMDSDYYEEDDPLFTFNRTEMKKKRHLRRNLDTGCDEIAEQPGNVTVINGFREYLIKKCNLSSNNDQKSTLSLSMGHLFLYNDSYLNFLTSRDENFRLERLFDFNDDNNMITISSPLNWIAVTGGPSGKEHPSRQLEQLKAHCRLREYLEHKLNDVTLNGQGLIKKLALTRNNEEISREIERLKIRKKLLDLYNSEKDKKRRMNQILVPEADMNEYEAVKTWFQSPESKEKEEEVVAIWKEGVRNHSSITERKFNKVASLARFTLAICDKSRPSSYCFTNGDYFDKTSVWLPEDKIKDMWILDRVPTDWKLYTAPDNVTKASCFEIRLYGSNKKAILKGKQFTPLIVNKKCYQFIEMYLDMKRIVLKANATVHDDVFFVNFRGLPMARLQRSKGNLVELFGIVTNNPKFKLTSLRKASEGVIQSKPQLAEVGKALNYHHSSVVPVYDNISCTRRTIYQSSLNENEGSSSMLRIEDEDLEDHIQARKTFELEEDSKRKEEAKKYLESKKSKKKVVDLTPFHFTKDNVDFLQSLFTDDNLTGILMTCN